MTTPKYIIEYQSIDNIEYPNASGMKRYLKEQKSIWAPLLEEVKNNNQLKNIPGQHGNTSAETLAKSFDTLINGLEDPNNFNRLTTRHRGGFIVPPPADSIEGQLILGLFTNGRKQDAVAAFLAFVSKTIGINQNPNQPIGRLVDRGEDLTIAAYAAEAVPFRNVTSQKLNGAVRSAENHSQSLKEEVEKAQETNSDHEQVLKDYRANWAKRAKRLENVGIRSERQRRRKFSAWISEIDDAVSERFTRAEKRLEAVDRANEKKQKERDAEFNRLLDLFHSQLRLRAPVQLWEGRAEEHEGKAKTARNWFIGFTILAVFMGALIPFCFGDYIASSFFTQVCEPEDPASCVREFSAKGPLTIAGLLVIMSLVLWAVRLQYKVFLSERHLALDANEKKAFAETYLAMKEGEDVGAGNEAIVLTSLFRPTQDGIIDDDDGTLDISAAAILAKQLGRGGS